MWSSPEDLPPLGEHYEKALEQTPIAKLRRIPARGVTMKVADLMHSDVTTIAPDASIADLVQSLAVSHVSGLPL
jgi:hypothetical protein